MADYWVSYGSYNYGYYQRLGLVSQNIAGNYSTVRTHAYIEVQGAYNISWSSGSASNHVWSFGLAASYGRGQSLVHYGDFNVGHESGGVFPGVSVGGSINTTFLMSGNCSTAAGRGAYPTIPRASDLNSFTCSSDILTGTYTCKYTPKLSTYYNRLRVSISGVKAIFYQELGQKATSQQTGTFSFTEDQLKVILETIGNTKGTVLIGCVIETYSNSGYTAKIGESSEGKLTMKVPTEISIVDPLVIDSDASVVAITGNSEYIVQGKSNLTVKVSTPSTVVDCVESNAPVVIKQYDITVNGVTKTLNGLGTVDFGKVSNDKDILGTYKVTDTRGNSKEVSFTVKVLPYSVPKVEVKKCYRSDSDMKENATSGTYFTVMAEFSVQSILVNGVEKNAISSRSIKLGSTVKSTTFSSGVALAMSGVDTSQDYDVVVLITDKFNETSTAPGFVRAAMIPIIIDAKKKSVGIGGYPTMDNCLEILYDNFKMGDGIITKEDFGYISIADEDDIVEG